MFHVYECLSLNLDPAKSDTVLQTASTFMQMDIVVALPWRYD